MSPKKVKSKPCKKNMQIELEVMDLAYGGKGIARLEGFVIFITGAVPGDRVRARITKARKNHAEGVVEEILRPSRHRVTPPCPLFDTCGGCTWQNLPYAMQLEHKEKQAAQTLEHLGSIAPEVVESIAPSPEQWRYRNKMDFTFGKNQQGESILGFHYPGMFWKILDVEKCLLQPEPIDGILGAMRDFARSHGLTTYDQKKHTGFLRHLIVRHSTHEDAYAVLLITHAGDLPEKESLVEELRAACPKMQGFIWAENTAIADIARVERERWQWGRPVLHEKLGDHIFRVSPLAFFQVNTAGAEKLYAIVYDMLGTPPPRSRLLDAYCGAGTIGIFCADKFEEVVGIEISRDAIWDARENASRNNVQNATFLAGNMRTTLPLAHNLPGGDFQRVVLDPPRGGMDKKSLQGLIQIGAPVMVYVSCNPSTLARDLRILEDAGYRPARMQAVDLFPQTYHIETVVQLVKTEAH